MGRVEHDHPRPRRDGAPHRVPVDRVVGEPQRHEDRRPAAQHDRRHIRVVARLEHDDLVARTDRGRDGVEDPFRAARRDGDFGLGVVAPAGEPFVLGGDRLAQPQDALHRRVLILPAAHVRGDGVDERRVAVEIGKALREVDRVQLGRKTRHHREDRRADRRQLRVDRDDTFASLGCAFASVARVVWLPDHDVASKIPLSRFLRTRFHAKYCPFIAMYTPGGSTCANDRALPRLKRPSELPNA